MLTCWSFKKDTVSMMNITVKKLGCPQGKAGSANDEPQGAKSGETGGLSHGNGLGQDRVEPCGGGRGKAGNTRLREPESKPSLSWNESKAGGDG